MNNTNNINNTNTNNTDIKTTESAGLGLKGEALVDFCQAFNDFHQSNLDARASRDEQCLVMYKSYAEGFNEDELARFTGHMQKIVSSHEAEYIGAILGMSVCQYLVSMHIRPLIEMSEKTYGDRNSKYPKAELRYYKMKAAKAINKYGYYSNGLPTLAREIKAQLSEGEIEALLKATINVICRVYRQAMPKLCVNKASRNFMKESILYGIERTKEDFDYVEKICLDALYAHFPEARGLYSKAFDYSLEKVQEIDFMCVKNMYFYPSLKTAIGFLLLEHKNTEGKTYAKMGSSWLNEKWGKWFERITKAKFKKKETCNSKYPDMIGRPEELSYCEELEKVCTIKDCLVSEEIDFLDQLAEYEEYIAGLKEKNAKLEAEGSKERYSALNTLRNTFKGDIAMSRLALAVFSEKDIHNFLAKNYPAYKYDPETKEYSPSLEF